MSWYMVYSGDLLIGWSMLEAGDRGKATAYGRFVASSSYDDVQADFIARREDDQILLGLHVVGHEGELQAHAVHLADYTDHGEGIEIAVFGIVEPAFHRLFPCS
ncbi:hypothetical protein [Dyella sp. C9]|uniref:hypothetical protein n=1 Tax=Dyella sp. C9 TaxID=2202154 RepID=UPI000DEEC437|nr:hypothetical protein [Dyella sp. C9]